MRNCSDRVAESNPRYVAKQSFALAFLTRLPAMSRIGGEILGEQRWEIPTTQVAKSEILGPVDDTCILGDNAGVEFASQDEQVEILP